ncbi:hypothetical protein [Faecalimicrobium sp. JNUCC 81]
MASKRNDYDRNQQCLYDECKRLMNYHTFFTMKDGTTFDGIIESVDRDYVIVLVGEDVIDKGCGEQYDENRQFGRPRRFRRFRRRVFPLSALGTLILLSFPFRE